MRYTNRHGLTLLYFRSVDRLMTLIDLIMIVGDLNIRMDSETTHTVVPGVSH